MKKHLVFIVCVAVLGVSLLVYFGVKNTKPASALIPPHYTGVKIESANDPNGYVFLNESDLSTYINSSVEFLEPAPDLKTEDWIYRITFGNNYALGTNESFFSEDSELIQICVYLHGVAIDDEKFIFSETARHETFLHDIGVKFDLYSESWSYPTPIVIP